MQINSYLRLPLNLSWSQLKKIVLVFLFTGAAHFASVFTMGICIRKLSTNHIKEIALFESYVLLCTSFVSLGIQIYASREIVGAKEDWRKVYSQIQSFRVLISFIVVLIGLIFYRPGIEKYIAFFLAPIIAINGDYALYALGKPVEASFCSFLRVALPVMLLYILISNFPGFFNLWIVFIFYFVSIFISSYTVSKIANVSLFYYPKLLNYKKFKIIGFIAISTFIYTNFRSSFLVYTEYFSNQINIEYLYAFIRIYLVFFSIRRILVQIYYKNIDNRSKVYQINLIIFGIIFSSLVLYNIFFESISSLLFGEKSSQLTGLRWDISKTVIASSLFSVFLTKLSLLKMDRAYIFSSLFPITIFFLVFFCESKEIFDPSVLITYFAITEFVIGIISFAFYYSSKSNRFKV